MNNIMNLDGREKFKLTDNLWTSKLNNEAD